MALVLLAAAFVDFKLSEAKKVYLVLLKSSVALIAVVILSGVLLINFYPGTLNDKPEPKTGSGDFTLDMFGWHELATEFNKFRLNDLKTG